MHLYVNILNRNLWRVRFRTHRSRIGRRPTPFLGTMKWGLLNPYLILLGETGSIASFSGGQQSPHVRQVCLGLSPKSLEHSWTWEVAWRTKSHSRVEFCEWFSETGWTAKATPPDTVQVAPKKQSTYPRWCSKGESSWMVQKASRSDPSPQNSSSPLADWLCVERHCVPQPQSLGRWKEGSWARVRRQSISHTVSPWTWEPRGKWNCYFFDNVGTAGPWTETKWNRRFSTQPSFMGRSDAVLAVSWERADCHISGLPAAARGSTRRPRCRFSLGWSSSGGCRRVHTEDWGLACGVVVAGGASRGKMFWFCTAENCWAKPSTVSPNCPAWEMGASRKRALSTSFISTRLSQTWRFWTTRVDIIFLRDLAIVFRHPEGEVSRRTQLLHQPRVRTTLKSNQVTIICIALLTVQIVSKQLYISLILSWVALHQLYSISTGK